MASPSNSDDRSKARSSKARLPFEPKSRKKSGPAVEPDAPVKGDGDNSVKASDKRANAKAAKVQAAKEKLTKMKMLSEQQRRQGGRGANKGGIPEVVTQRMVKRMALLAGTPMLLGVATFFVSYYIVSRDLLQLPTVAVLLVSLGFFGLSVLGLSYGALSASWEETSEAGSFWGWQEFRLNFGRMRGSWKDAKEARNS